jgi:hypothetical protein
MSIRGETVASAGAFCLLAYLVLDPLYLPFSGLRNIELLILAFVNTGFLVAGGVFIGVSIRALLSKSGVTSRKRIAIDVFFIFSVAIMTVFACVRDVLFYKYFNNSLMEVEAMRLFCNSLFQYFAPALSGYLA